MKRSICTSLILSLFALGFVMSAQAQNLIRKSAEFRNFAADETVTGLGVPGISIYTKSVSFGALENIIYVTISATGDTHGGAASWFSCRVSLDGGVAWSFCNPGFGGAAGAPPGWIALQKMNASAVTTNCNDGGGGTGDCHDNNVNYQWCKALPAAFVAVGGPVLVNLRMAVSGAPGPDPVTGILKLAFIEAAHFYIDSTKGGSPTCAAGVAGP